MAEENEKVLNIIIPTKKLFFLIKSLKEERKMLRPNMEEPKIELKRYKLKVQHDVLNDILHHYGVDGLLAKLCPNSHAKELVGAIPKGDEDEN